MPLTVEDMTWNKTGTWRLLTPKVQGKMSPCRAACPIGQPIANIMSAVSEGDWNRALQMLLEINPLPGVTGRLCYHPCQAKCLRKELDRPVSIQGFGKASGRLRGDSRSPPQGPNREEGRCLRRRPGWFDCRLSPRASRLRSHSSRSRPPTRRFPEERKTGKAAGRGVGAGDKPTGRY